MTDLSGFPDFYAAHCDAARRTARALVPAHAADDIVSEAFTRVLAVMTAGGGPCGDFRPYLLAAVRNVARTWLADRARTVPVACPEPRGSAPAAGEIAARREELRMAGRAFDSLPPRWRAVLWQTEVEGTSPADLAEMSGMTPNGVAQLASRARLGYARAWQRERGDQERRTGPLPLLTRYAARKNHRRSA